MNITSGMDKVLAAIVVLFSCDLFSNLLLYPLSFDTT